MHEAVIKFVEKWAKEVPDEVRVLDIGGAKVSTSRYYNGSTPRDLFPRAEVYHVLDQMDRSDVDIVADATQTIGIAGAYDVIVCTEVLEHVEAWPEILRTAYQALRDGGRLILTCAGPGRRPHPATSEELNPPPGEWYKNVSHVEVREALERIGFRDILTYQVGFDTQAAAVK
jgi:SAM-dependent methyltransferase